MKGEQELKEYAVEQSRTIVIRTYNGGNSSDVKRVTTEKERDIILSVIFGALLAIRNNCEEQCAADTAEFIGKLLLPGMNGYDTVYCRIKEFPW